MQTAGRERRRRENSGLLNERHLVDDLVGKGAFNFRRVVSGECEKVGHAAQETRHCVSRHVAHINVLWIDATGCSVIKKVARDIRGGVGVPGQGHVAGDCAK